MFECPPCAVKRHKCVLTCSILLNSQKILQAEGYGILITVHSALSPLPVSTPHSTQTYFWCHNISGSSHQDGARPMQSQCGLFTSIFPRSWQRWPQLCLPGYGSGRIKILDLYCHGPCHMDIVCSLQERVKPNRDKSGWSKMEAVGGGCCPKRGAIRHKHTPEKPECLDPVSPGLAPHPLLCGWLLSTSKCPPTFLFSDFEFSQLQIEES